MKQEEGRGGDYADGGETEDGASKEEDDCVRREEEGEGNDKKAEAGEKERG